MRVSSANAGLQSELIRKESMQDVMCQLLKKSGSYCTAQGRVKGVLTISEYFICFDVESEKCIVKRRDGRKDEATHKEFYCYVDMHDVLQCKYVVEGVKHFLHIFAAVKGDNAMLVKIVFRLSKKKDVFDDFLTSEKLTEECLILSKAILDFRNQLGPTEPRTNSVIPFFEEFGDPEQFTSLKSTSDALAMGTGEEGEWFSDSSEEVPAEENEITHSLPTLSVSDSPLFQGLLRKKVQSIKSSILSEAMFVSLRNELSPVFQLRNWKLVYSPSEHGCVLRTLYRNACDFGATVLVIRDHTHTVFGGFLSEPWRVTKRYYGTGESFLFTFKNGTFRAFHPTLMDEYYAISDLQAIIFGGGGLFVASDLVSGRSTYCDTYANEDLAGEVDFKILDMEVWGFS